MASEDSDQLISGLLSVHGSHHLDDRHQALSREVLVGLHPLEAPGELLEVLSLRRAQRMVREERDDHSDEVASSSNHVAVHRLAARPSLRRVMTTEPTPKNSRRS